MYQLINNLALAATLIALVAGLWHDWSLLTTVRRMAVSYLGFFFLGGFMALAVKLVGLLEKDPKGAAEPGSRSSAGMTEHEAGQ